MPLENFHKDLAELQCCLGSNSYVSDWVQDYSRKYPKSIEIGNKGHSFENSNWNIVFGQRRVDNIRASRQQAKEIRQAEGSCIRILEEIWEIDGIGMQAYWFIGDSGWAKHCFEGIWERENTFQMLYCYDSPSANEKIKKLYR